MVVVLAAVLAVLAACAAAAGPGNDVPLPPLVSSKSGAVLEFGRFYHLVGHAVDLTSEEVHQLPREEQARFVLVLNEEMRGGFAHDYAPAAPANATGASSEQLGDSVEPTSASLPRTGTLADAVVGDPIFLRSQPDQPAGTINAPTLLTEAQQAELSHPALPRQQEAVVQVPSATQGLVTDRLDGAWRSSISGAPLHFGHFYHKLGEAYDVTDSEFRLFSVPERLRYVRIDSAKDIAAHQSDWAVSGSVVNAVASNHLLPPSKTPAVQDKHAPKQQHQQKAAPKATATVPRTTRHAARITRPITLQDTPQGKLIKRDVRPPNPALLPRARL